MAAIFDFRSERFYLLLIYKSPQCFLPSLESSGFWGLGEEEKNRFSRWQPGGHLGFPIGTIFAIFI